MRYQLPVLAATLVLAACSTGLAKRTDEPTRYDDYADAPIDGFRMLNLDSWQAVSRNRLLLWNGPSEAYLVTVRGNCANLRFAETVNVSSTGNEVTRLDRVAVDGDRCPIDSIRPLDVQAMREDRQAERDER